MPKKNPDNLSNRREFIFVKVNALFCRDDINTVKAALVHIADELLFLDYTTVYRDYVSYIKGNKAKNL